jgi:hypothetical protein
VTFQATCGQQMPLPQRAAICFTLQNKSSGVITALRDVVVPLFVTSTILSCQNGNIIKDQNYRALICDLVQEKIFPFIPESRSSLLLDY